MEESQQRLETLYERLSMQRELCNISDLLYDIHKPGMKETLKEIKKLEQQS